MIVNFYTQWSAKILNVSFELSELLYSQYCPPHHHFEKPCNKTIHHRYIHWHGHANWHTKHSIRTSSWKKWKKHLPPLTHSALPQQLCGSHSDKGLAAKLVTSSASVLTDLPGAAWLTSPQKQRTSRAGTHSGYIMLPVCLMNILLSRTIICTPFEVAVYAHRGPFLPKKGSFLWKHLITQCPLMAHSVYQSVLTGWMMLLGWYGEENGMLWEEE